MLKCKISILARNRPILQTYCVLYRTKSLNSCRQRRFGEGRRMQLLNYQRMLQMRWKNLWFQISIFHSLQLLLLLPEGQIVNLKSGGSSTRSWRRRRRSRKSWKEWVFEKSEEIWRKFSGLSRLKNCPRWPAQEKDGGIWDTIQANHHSGWPVEKSEGKICESCFPNGKQFLMKK